MASYSKTRCIHLLIIKLLFEYDTCWPDQVAPFFRKNALSCKESALASKRFNASFKFPQNKSSDFPISKIVGSGSPVTSGDLNHIPMENEVKDFILLEAGSV